MKNMDDDTDGKKSPGLISIIFPGESLFNWKRCHNNVACDEILLDNISWEIRFLFEFRSGSAEYDWRTDQLGKIGVLDHRNRLVSVICHYWGIAQKNLTIKESEMSKFSRNSIFDLAVDEIHG